MRHARALAILLSLFAFSAQAMQAPPQKPPAKPPAAGTGTTEPLDIWQIDLNPTGTGFALTTPVLEGDTYVFKVWPDRQVVRLNKAKVKKMVRRTKDINSEVIYQIDLVPTGQVYSREVPQQRGTNIEYKSWHQGTLMALRQADVRKVTKVAGLDAFKIHLQLLGAKAIGNLPMEGGGSVTVVNERPAPAPEHADPAMAPSNWIFNGVPGVTDAWAPPSAVIASPGDVPRAREH